MITFNDWYATNELKIQSMARFTTNPYKLMEFAWDERDNQNQWQSIETAPRDGTHILLYKSGIQFVGYWENGYWVINIARLSVVASFPTHWKPLPYDPETDEP
jgi:hypothetical protein